MVERVRCPGGTFAAVFGDESKDDKGLGRAIHGTPQSPPEELREHEGVFGGGHDPVPRPDLAGPQPHGS